VSNNLPYLMLAVAILLSLWLVSPIVADIRAAFIKRRLRRRIHQEQIAWPERRARRMREALR